MIDASVPSQLFLNIDLFSCYLIAASTVCCIRIFHMIIPGTGRFAIVCGSCRLRKTGISRWSRFPQRRHTEEPCISGSSEYERKHPRNTSYSQDVAADGNCRVYGCRVFLFVCLFLAIVPDQSVDVELGRVTFLAKRLPLPEIFSNSTMHRVGDCHHYIRARYKK